MRLVVFSDVHGNLPALEIMLKDAGEVDGYICLGDIVDYGPWSNECVDLISSLENITIVRGNHEDYFINGVYRANNPVSQAFFDFCYPTFNRRAAISNLAEEYRFSGFIFRHTIHNQNIYPDSELKLDANYVIGHSHHQFKLSQPPFTLHNPGSVGQNRKYINVINYSLLETETMQFTPRAVVYDEQIIINEMRSKRYPSLCIEYYDQKLRLKAD